MALLSNVGLLIGGVGLLCVVGGTLDFMYGEGTSTMSLGAVGGVLLAIGLGLYALGGGGGVPLELTEDMVALPAQQG